MEFIFYYLLLRFFIAAIFFFGVEIMFPGFWYERYQEIVQLFKSLK